MAVPGNGEEPGTALLTHGEIIFEAGGAPFTGATVYIRLDDVSRANAASETVVEEVIRGVSTADEPLPFQLRGALTDERASYNISVHVDVNNDGEINSGDYLTMESYPVSIQEHSAPLTIQVRLLR